MQSLTMEGSSLSVFSLLKSGARCFSEAGVVLDEIREVFVVFRNISFNYIPETCNQVPSSCWGYKRG